MPGTFMYVPRERCICAAPLNPDRLKVEKATRWGPIRFVACDVCGSVVQSPQVSPHSLADWFSSPEYYAAGPNAGGPYLNYLADEGGRRQEAEARYLRDLQPILPPGADVLEVGCATGSMLAVLARHGHRVTGIDLSTAFVDAAKRLNDLSVIQGDFLQYRRRDAFDLIIMLGTISNLPDLGAAFAHCHALLRAGGRLYFNVPIAGSWPARIYGRHFWMYSPSVCAFVSLQGCRTALTRAGFRVVRTAADYQMPTVAKLAGHLGLRRLYPRLERLGLVRVTSPIAWPVPGVRVVLAEKAD